MVKVGHHSTEINYNFLKGSKPHIHNNVQDFVVQYKFLFSEDKLVNTVEGKKFSITISPIKFLMRSCAFSI